MKTLENWSVAQDPADIYKAPELIRPKLQGEVFGHPGHQDGKHVVTSSIVGKNKRGHVRTRNSVYKLGKIDPNYEARFPNARKRLLGSLPCQT